MSEPDAQENHRCSGVLVQKQAKKGSKSVTSATAAAVGASVDVVHDGQSNHQLNGFDNHVPPQIENQLESTEAVVNHVQTVNIVSYNDAGHVNGDVPSNGGSDTEVKDVRRKRRSQSESSDGSPRSKSLQESDVGFMWTQANGHHTVPEPVPEPDHISFSPDVFYSPAQEVENGRSTDDMNGYVNANAHMLAYLELNRESPRVASPENRNLVLPDNVNGLAPNGNENGEIEDELQSDKIDEGIALAAELEFIPLATTKLSTSSEDQGDFIETDISLQQLGFSSYASSRGSSCNDLPNLVQASDRGEQHNHNNNVTKDSHGAEKIHQLHHKCESCERNQQASTPGAFNFASSQPADCYNTEDHGGAIKPQQPQAPSSGRQTTNGVFTFQTDSRNIPHAAASDEQEATFAWHNISQPTPQRKHSATNRSSTSSFYSPDMDIEFMDLDFEPGLVNSDSQQDFQPSESVVWPPTDNHLNPSSSSRHGADRDKFSDNDDNIDNCFCYGCDKISDKFSNHSSHFKSCSSAKANPLISCCRHQHHHHNLKGHSRGDGESSSSVKQNAPRCNNCDEQSADNERNETQNNVSDDGNAAAEHVEGAVGFSSANCGQSHSVPNNLDMVGSSWNWNRCVGDAAHYNVSRQTSTSNFDQDENNFQDYFVGFESNLNKPEGDSRECAQGKYHYFTRPKDVCVRENEPLLHGAHFSRMSYMGRQEREEDNEADDEQEEEDEGTPPPIPNTRPPLNRRLELLNAHNQNLEQNLLPFAAPSPSLNSENQVLAGAVGGPDFRPGATNFGDDESPSRALHLLEYQFQPDDIDFNSRRHVPRPNWLPQDDDSPMRALRFFEQGVTSGEGTRQMCGEDGCSDISPTVGGLAHMGGMDSLTDMFVNLEYKYLQLCKKPLSRRGRLLVTEKCDDASMEKVMIWSEYEAYVLQVKQIGVSACGATAVINVLKAFDIYPDKTAVCKAVKTNLRAEMSSVPEYLLSRSVAGTTAHHLIEGIDELTNGDIYGRFFHFWPPRDVELRKWLADWMKKGAVPVVTLNLQKGVPAEVQIPDAWHHQMVYGVGPKGIYLTNPLDVVSEAAIFEQLTSDSVLLVRRSDIILRWTNSANLGILLNHTDTRWRTMNVAGQVVNAMRESNRPRIPGFRPQQTSHVLIPAFYKAGVTLFVKKDSQVYHELLEAPDVPIKRDDGPKCTTNTDDTKAANHMSPTQPPQIPVTSSQVDEPSTSANCTTTTTSTDESQS